MRIKTILGALAFAALPTVASAHSIHHTTPLAHWYSCRLTTRGNEITARRCRTYAMPRATRRPTGWWIERTRIDTEHERSVRYPTFELSKPRHSNIATDFASSSGAQAYGLPGCPPAIARWAYLIVPAAHTYNLPVAELTGVMEIESQGNPQAVNPASGASGLFQFLPSTASALGINPFDPAQATYAAAAYISAHGLIGFSGGGYASAWGCD